VDYYSIQKKDNIGTLSAQVTVDNESLFRDRVTRGAVPSGDPYSVGPITLVDVSSMNFLKARNEGFDVALGYRKATSQHGKFQLNLTQTFARHYLRQTVFGAPYVDWVNTSGSGPLKYRSAATLDWEFRRWTLGWSTYYYGHYKVLAPPLTTSTASIVRQGGLHVSGQIYHNAFATYRFGGGLAGTSSRLGWLTRGLELQVGIENLFNKIPPYEGNSPNGFTYSTWGNLRLREYRLSLRKAF
jgi:hypothetical protein